MDISRLPVTPALRPASAPKPTSRQAAAPAQAGERLADGAARESSRGSDKRVLQGELLQRQTATYQSTRAFIDERILQRAQPAGWQTDSLNRTRVAIAHYLNNTTPAAAAGSDRGRSVNFFV